jgi:rubrerythrin
MKNLFEQASILRGVIHGNLGKSESDPSRRNVGYTFPREPIICHNCNVSYDGYQHKSVCPFCGAEREKKEKGEKK